MNSTMRRALLGSVSTAAVFFMPASAFAQATTCSQTGTTITCVDGANTVLTETTPVTNVAIPGPGLSTVNSGGAATLSYTATGTIATTGAPAVTLTTVGSPLTFKPVTGSPAVNIATTGAAANGLTINAAGQPVTARVGNISTTGANTFGVLSNAGGDLTLTTGNISTTGAGSTAIDAGNQTGNIAVIAGDITSTGRGIRTNSITDGTNTTVVGNLVTGDRGILANGGSVSITTGNVTTSTNGGTTPGGYGVIAQSFAGNATVTTGAVTSSNGGAGVGANVLGATGSAVIRTGAVTSSNNSAIFARASNATGSIDIGGCPTVSTTGNGFSAIFADVQGTGTATINCGAVQTTGDNATGVFVSSGGGNILSTTTSVTTAGVGSFGVSTKTSGVGTVATNAGTITTTGNNAGGLSISAGTGAVDAGYGNITTSGTGNANALFVASTGTINLRGNGATLRTNGAGVTAALLSGAGVTGNLGNLTTTGAGAQGAIITTTAPVNVTVGAVTTTNNGLIINAGTNAVTLTTGAVTATESGATGTVINATGAVLFTGGRQTANGANALRITGGAGAITATVAGAATTGTGTAVSVTGTGPVTVTNTGTITTVGANSDGINAVSAGAVTVNGGQVGTTGANSRGIFANGGGAVAVTSTGATATGGNASAIVATSTGSSVGVTLSGTNSSAMLDGVNISAATTASLALTGGTLAAANNGATIASGTGATVTNAGSISGNTYALSISGGSATINNSGTISGRILTTANADIVNNSGLFNPTGTSDFGAGVDVFNNSGILRVLGTSTTAGTVTFANLESFANTGLVDLRNGHVGDVLVLGGAYSGGGAAQLGLDVILGTATGTSDQLRLGGAATGSTVVSLTTLNTAPAVLSTATGTVLVQAGAASAAGAFTLNSANVDQGLIQYGIIYNPTTFAYSLVGTPGAGVYRSAVFAGGARNLWLQSGDAWSGHMRELRDNVAANGPGGAGGRIWAQAIGQVEQRSSNRSFTFNGITTPVNLGYKQDYFGGQLGIDFGGPAGSSAFAFGATGGYLNSNLNFANSADRIDFDAVNGGVYASYSGGIFFVNALGKYDYYWGRNVSVSGGYGQKVKGSIYGGKAEAGFRFGQAFWVEPSASVSYTHSDFDNFTVASGTFNFNDADGVRGKAGARLGFTTDAGPAKLTVYGGGNYVHEFKGEDRVSFVSAGQTATFANTRGRDYGEGTIGVNIGSKQGAISGFFEGRYANGGDYEGYGGRAGMRFRF